MLPPIAGLDGPWQEKEEKIRHPLRLTQTAAALLPKASLPPLAPLSFPSMAFRICPGRVVTHQDAVLDGCRHAGSPVGNLLLFRCP